MNRRNLLAGLAGILAAGFAPAAIGSGVLMPIRQLSMPRDAWLQRVPPIWFIGYQTVVVHGPDCGVDRSFTFGGPETRRLDGIWRVGRDPVALELA
jgi:hypothetical protein